MEDTGVLPPLPSRPHLFPNEVNNFALLRDFKKRVNPKEAPSMWKKSMVEKKQRGPGRWVEIIFVDVGLEILKVLRTLKKNIIP